MTEAVKRYGYSDRGPEPGFPVTRYRLHHFKSRWFPPSSPPVVVDRAGAGERSSGPRVGAPRRRRLHRGRLRRPAPALGARL